MGQQDFFHSTCMMGAWIVDMTDRDAAHAAIAQCKARTPASLEVRHTLWGVQVRTDSGDAASLLADHYAPVAARLAA